MKYSANLGFLWTELKLEEAIVQAKKNNFDAVEYGHILKIKSHQRVSIRQVQYCV